MTFRNLTFLLRIPKVVLVEEEEEEERERAGGVNFFFRSLIRRLYITSKRGIFRG